MMRSLYSGISGLRNHQTRMDVIGNNIANVNTAGYKTSRVIFQDIFSQNVSSGMANNNQPVGGGGIGGTNPVQVGLGIRLSTVDVIHTRAAFQRTDRETDMMINGDGFFIVRGPDGDFFTRAGNFDIDNEGYLVNSLGFYVMGYTSELQMAVIDPGQEEIEARAQVDFAAGATVPVGTVIPAGIFATGTALPAHLFGYNSPPEGSIAEAPWPEKAMRTRIEFNAPAAFTSLAAGSQPFRAPTFGLVPVGQNPESDINGLSRIRVTSDVYYNIPAWEDLTADQQDAPIDMIGSGNPEADFDPDFFNQFPQETVSLPGFAVSDNGDVSVILANRKVVIGRIAVAMFANPSGLEKGGNSLYRESASSGPAVITEAYLDGAGKIDGGGLEMSNVDLANEFTDMIVTQRGFQANSRIITVSDTMLEELVNLKR